MSVCVEMKDETLLPSFVFILVVHLSVPSSCLFSCYLESRLVTCKLPNESGAGDECTCRWYITPGRI
jgi:hypothetical protein